MVVIQVRWSTGDGNGSVHAAGGCADSRVIKLVLTVVLSR